MASAHAVVVVTLRSKQDLQSPIVSREEAEAALAAIGGARAREEEINLSWISVFGGDVEAVHLKERHKPSDLPSSSTAA